MITKNKTFFITGVSGFIGGALSKSLTSEGHKVIGLSRRKSEFTTIQKDINDLTKKDLHLSDTVIHLATAYNEEGILNQENISKVNIEGTERLLKLSKQSNIQRFIYLSTGGIFERGKNITLNTKRFSKLEENVYLKTKAIATDLLLNEVEMDICVAYLFFPYGPNQKEPRLIPRLINRIKNNKEVTITKEGGPELSFIYIDDLIEQLKRICISSEIRREEIISGEPVKISKIVKIIGDLVRKEPLLKVEEGFDDLTAADTSHMITKYTPQVSIEEGLKRTILS
jgi:dihydroflavonol-4-reductase